MPLKPTAPSRVTPSAATSAHGEGRERSTRESVDALIAATEAYNRERDREREADERRRMERARFTFD